MDRRDPLIERGAELRHLSSVLAEARAGHPHIVVVHGEPGMGKTVLLDAFLAPLRAEGRVLEATADEAERDLGYGVLHQLTLGTSSALHEQLTEVIAGRRPAPDPRVAGVEFLTFLDDIAADGPVVLVIDDVGWADRPSLDALSFALRRLRVDPVLVILALRSGAEETLPAGLSRLTQGPGGSWLELAGLSPDGLTELGRTTDAGDLSPASARVLRLHTGGNPLYALALLRELGPNGFGNDEPLEVPPSLAMLLLSRLATCSSIAVELVQAASVLGRHPELELVARVAGVDDPLPALEETTMAGLMHVEGLDRRRVVFDHPLVQAAVYSDLGAVQRTRLHRAAAAALSGDAALDQHVRAATGYDDTLADELRVRAASVAARHRWADAARHLLAASRLHSDAEVRTDSLHRAAAYRLAGADYLGAAVLAEEIRELGPGPWRDYVLAHLALISGELSAATAQLEAALAQCDAEGEPYLYSVLAFLLSECQVMLGGRGLRCAGLGRLALRVAPPESPARMAWLVVLFGEGASGQARAALGSAPTPDALEPGLERLGLTLGRALAYLYIDDLDAAREHLAAISTTVVRDGPSTLTWPTLVHLAEVEFRAGRWDDALASAHLGSSIASDGDDVLAMAMYAPVIAGILALRGEWEAAERALAPAEERGAANEVVAIRIGIAVARARLAFARGDPAALLDAVEALLPIAHEDGVREHGVTPWRDLQADALVRLERFDEAEEVIAALERHAAERDLDSARTAAWRVRGSLEAARERPAAARDAFERSVHVSQGLGMPFQRGLALLESARFERRTASPRQAGSRLEEAAAIFRSLGAGPFLERAERELGATARRRARRGDADLALTPQEYAVARLVAQGRRNREVAAELVVSVKTVEYHLSNVYGKLGIDSRSQLAATFRERGGRVGGAAT